MTFYHHKRDTTDASGTVVPRVDESEFRKIEEL
jgi:hypothetical protein